MYYPQYNTYSVPMVNPLQAPSQIDRPVLKTAKEAIAEHYEKLDKPSESVAFLEYFQNHLKKVGFLEVRLKTFSYCLLIPGVAYLAC